MKTVLMTLLIFLSLPVLANRVSPMGLFQVDSSRSTLLLADGDKVVSGFIDIKQKFPESTFKFESGNSSFEGHTVEGTLENFTVKGTLYRTGETREITLHGQYFGLIDKETEHRRIALKITSDECEARIFALQPTSSATALHKEVQEIIQ